MTLADWLTDNDSTQAALADALGVSKAYISMLAAGTRVPSLAVACRIQIATDEAVKPADFLDA